jgi:CubicO group peptidase (beta-lactamase class C family)
MGLDEGTIRVKIRGAMGEGQFREWLDALAALGGAVSALEAVVADGERVRFRHAAGYRVGGERLVAASDARFDAASLTKPWMATLAMALDADGEGELRLGETLPDADETTLEALLRHRSGMGAWMPLAVRLGRSLADAAALRDFLLEELRRRTGESDACVYSDLDYLLWGLLAEERCGKPLAELLDRRICEPLGAAPLGKMALGEEMANPVECRLDNGKEVELAAKQGLGLGLQRSFLRGVPQDGNARSLRAAGRLGAHAGLFVTADEMLALAREWLRPGRILSRERVAHALAGEGEYALGWARWSESGSSGPALSAASFGHTGFTGGSVWIDPERERIYLLLAHKLASSLDFNPIRREYHARAAELG